MDPSAYTDDSPGRLLKQGRGDAAFLAFAPDPLPPGLQFSLNLINALAGASRAVGELVGLARTLTNPHLFVRPFMRREAIASSRIEGTQAELDELYVFEAEQRVLPGIRSGAPASAVQEVHNYVLALDYGLDRLDELPMSLRLVREMHARLMQGVRGEHGTPGEFRRTQNWIGPPGCGLTEATYVPPPVAEMTQALGQLEKYLHGDGDDYHPLVRLAFVHYQFESIHPFVDGNGRLGRLLLSLLAVHWGLIPQPLLYLSAFFERHRERYYDLLMAVTLRGEWEAWTTFFLQAVTEQARDAVDRTKRLQDLQIEWRSQLARERSQKPLQLVDYLFESPVITIPKAQQVLDVTYHTARSTIGKLVERGMLRQTRDDEYGRKFVADGIMSILQDAGAIE